MTGQQIPQRLDPFKQIGAGLIHEGSVSLNRLSRLEGLLANQDGEVHLTLRFDRDEQKMAVVAGELKAELNLLCQRCNAIDQFQVDSEFRFALLRSEDEIENLPEIYEPLVLESPELDVFELIEEELILALPIVHYHEDSCSEDLGQSFGEIADDEEERSNPFSVLEQLKS